MFSSTHHHQINMDSSQPGPSQPRAEEAGPSLAELLDQGGFCVYPLPWCPHLELLPDTWPDTVKWVQARAANDFRIREKDLKGLLHVKSSRSLV